MNRARIAVFCLLLILASLFRAVGDPVRPSGTILGGIPAAGQSEDYTCGPASLAAVFGYYGVPVTETEITAEARVNRDVGAEMEDLAAVAERHGLKAWVREGLSLTDLEAELAAGYPVIILTNARPFYPSNSPPASSGEDPPPVSWSQDWDDGHYLVVTGMDDRVVYVEDPRGGVYGYIPREEFVERWHGWTIDQRQVNGQALLIHGMPRRPAAPPPRSWRRIP